MLAATEPVLPTEPVVSKMPSTVILRSLDAVDFAVPSAQLKLADAVQRYFNNTTNETTENKEDQVPTLTLVSKQGAMPILQIPHVSSLILSKVIQFLASHTDLPEYSEESFKVLDTDFELYDAMDNNELLQIAFAANILDVPHLLHTIGEVLAKKMNAQEDEEHIKKMFTIDELPVVEGKEQADGDDMDEGEWEEMDEEEEQAETQ